MVTVRRIALACLASLACLALAAAPAHAQSKKLAQARAAVEKVRYDQAQELLADALREGGQPRQAVLEIYTLAASTAVVMGQTELAEQFYRRLLSIHPEAKLEEGLAPKFKQPFNAAVAYVDAHGAVRARARRLPSGEVEVVVESDPLKMVDAVALATGSAEPSQFDADRRALLPAPGEASPGELVLLDDRRNQLVVLATPVDALASVTVTDAPPSVGPSGPGLMRTWWVWAIPSGVALAVGIGAGMSASSASDDLAEGLENRTLFYDDAKDLRDKVSSRSTIANVSFATAGVFAVAAGVVWFTRPKGSAPRTAVLPLVPAGREGGLGLMLSGTLP